MNNSEKHIKSKELYEFSEFKTNTSGYCTVVEYNNFNDVVVKFSNTGSSVRTSICKLKQGKVKDYSAPSVYGVGVLGKNFKRGSKDDKTYQLWADMLERCYSEKLHKKHPTYRTCKVSDKFKDYEYFTKWCHSQIGFNNDTWTLDKDLLIKGNKIYSEDTCCFIPQELNKVLVKSDKIRGDNLIGVYYCKRKRKYKATLSVSGKTTSLGHYNTEFEAFIAYKDGKEEHIKSLAEKWKDKIDVRVYEALMNWSIEITD